MSLQRWIIAGLWLLFVDSPARFVRNNASRRRVASIYLPAVDPKSNSPSRARRPLRAPNSWTAVRPAIPAFCQSVVLAASITP